MTEPIRYTGNPLNINKSLHDGGLEQAVGVHTFQVVRANRTDPPDTGNRANTYIHQPNMAYWRGRFWVQFLGAPRNEHDERTETFLTSSPDGQHWDTPHVIFPAIEYDTWKRTIAHQRVGFYTADSGRLLTISFYGMPYPDEPHGFPNYGYGVGRAVREVYPDGSCGPIYFLRYMPKSGFDEERCNQFYPHFSKSTDPGFVKACQEILDDKLFHQQMWEEDRNNDDNFFTLHWEGATYPEGKAFSYWTCPDGTVAGIWKGPYASLSDDGGKSWTEPAFLSTIHPNTSKYWGQRTSDGKYALVYTAFNGKEQQLRTPLVVITGEDGREFDRSFLIMGDVPPQCFSGALRSAGPQYVRGIVARNGTPPDDCLWVVYSMSKEGIYVSKVPVPITDSVTEHIDDDFADVAANLWDKWNLFAGFWVPIRHGEAGGRCALVLEDKDRYNYARAVRVFPESESVILTCDVYLSGHGPKPRQIDIAGREGKRPVRLELVPSGRPASEPQSGARRIEIPDNTWTTLNITVDCKGGTYEVSIGGSDDTPLKCDFAEPCETVKRFELRTDRYRMADERPYTRKPFPPHDLPRADEPLPLSTLALARLTTS